MTLTIGSARRPTEPRHPVRHALLSRCPASVRALLGAPPPAHRPLPTHHPTRWTRGGPTAGTRARHRQGGHTRSPPRREPGAGSGVSPRAGSASPPTRPRPTTQPNALPPPPQPAAHRTHPDGRTRRQRRAPARQAGCCWLIRGLRDDGCTTPLGLCRPSSFSGVGSCRCVGWNWRRSRRRPCGWLGRRSRRGVWRCGSGTSSGRCSPTRSSGICSRCGGARRVAGPAGAGAGVAVRGGAHRPAGRGCGPLAAGLEVRPRAGAGRSGLRLLGAQRVPGPAGRGGGRAARCSKRF